MREEKKKAGSIAIQVVFTQEVFNLLLHCSYLHLCTAVSVGAYKFIYYYLLHAVRIKLSREFKDEKPFKHINNSIITLRVYYVCVLSNNCPKLCFTELLMPVSL